MVFEALKINKCFDQLPKSLGSF